MTSLLSAKKRAEEFATVIDGGADESTLRPELAELVGVVGTLQREAQAGARVAPRAEFSAELRERLMAEAATALVTDNILALPVRKKGRRERRIALVASSLVLVGGTAGMAAAAQNALPGEALYPIKRGLEKAQTELATSRAAQGEDLLAHADSRLVEVEGLLAGSDDLSQVPSTIDDFTRQAVRDTDLGRGLRDLRWAVAHVLGLVPAPAMAGAPALFGGPTIALSDTVIEADPSSSTGRAGRTPSATPGRTGGQGSGPDHADSDLAASSAVDEAEASRLIALVELARNGDAEAFGLLYDHYQGSVYRFLYYRVGSVALAEDLTSETFFRALRSMSSFRWQGKDFGAWLMTIARNLTTDHYKSSRTRLESTTEDMSPHDSATEGPESAVLASLTNEALLTALKKLPSEQQECLIMRFLQGLSIAETAQVLGRSDGAIKQLQLRGVRNLAKLMPEGLR